MSVPCPTVMFEKIDSSKFKETHREDPVINFEAEGGWVLTRRAIPAGRRSNTRWVSRT